MYRNGIKIIIYFYKKHRILRISTRHFGKFLDDENIDPINILTFLEIISQLFLFQASPIALHSLSIYLSSIITRD
jgi:hypothetical protein